MNIVMIGAGNMGYPYAESMAHSGFLKNKKLKIYDRNPEKMNAIEKKGILKACNKLEDCLPSANLIFLAVKPQQIEGLFKEIKPLINNEQLIVSIMAGVKLNTIINGLGIEKVIRTMPNLPAKIAKGVTAYTESKAVSPEELDLVKNLINMTGASIYVTEEKALDATTAISGSGPAYVFYFIQALMDAVEHLGFSKTHARQLVVSIFEEANYQIKCSKKSSKECLKDMINQDPNLDQAINSLHKKQVNKFIEAALFAAHKRAEELGKEK